jgi:hypothetical protein
MQQDPASQMALILGTWTLQTLLEEGFPNEGSVVPDGSETLNTPVAAHDYHLPALALLILWVHEGSLPFR